MMDEPRMTVKRLAYLYGCTPKTAGNYIRQMPDYMAHPLSATMESFREWEESRIVRKAERPRRETTKKQTGRVIVPRHR